MRSSCHLGVAALVAASGAFAQTSIENVCFIDRGASGEINLGSVNGAPCAIDYDKDGYTDLIIRAGGQMIRVFHNVPDPGRSWGRTFEEVTANTVFATFTGSGATSQAALAADFDNDGWTDVYVMGRRTIETVSGRLYRNNGAGDFIDVTEQSGVQADGDDPECASWVDYDLDGWVDLMVVSRVGSAHPWRLLRNNGNGTFEDVTASVLPSPGAWSRAYGHTWTDVDGDGYPDCFLIPSSGPVLLHNKPGPGPGGRRLVNEAFQRGFTVLGPAPMGISAGDYDNDGDFDIGISNGAIGVYYENLGDGTVAQRNLMESVFAWGVLWLDVNNDGWLDHYQAGGVGQGPNHNKLFLNRTDGTFSDISPALNDLVVLSQFALQFDFNNDGRQDILTQNPYNTPVFSSVNENVSTTGHNWIKVRVRGGGEARRVNADAIGTVIRVHAGGMVQSREVTSGSSTHSTDEFRQHFGLGKAAVVDRIEVIWPRMGSLAERTDVFEGPFDAGQVIDLAPRCRPDMNEDGTINSQDFFTFLSAFFAGSAASDFNADGKVDSQDFFDFLTAFFVGC